MTFEECYGIGWCILSLALHFCGETIDPLILLIRSAQKNNVIKLHIRTRHFEIISVSGDPPSGVSEWPRE